jgi:NhaP-type Na+/H+ or K+/H+ antiporter
VTTDEVLLGVGLIFVLAVGCQVLASLLRIPALILLLPAGFLAGAATDDVDPNRLLGATFEPLVSLSVAVILYDAGLGLLLGKTDRPTRRVVGRLIWLGVPVTWALAAVSAAPLLGMSREAALMLGAILIVSGPTVVGPLLAYVRPSERVQRILIWEASLIDPVGGILGAVVFSAVLAGQHGQPIRQLAEFLISIGIGVAGGAVGAALLWLLLAKLQFGEALGTTAQLACVIAVAAACDIVRDDTGLIAAILMGLAVSNRRIFDIPARQPFFETLIQLIIGLLFVSISATVTPASLQHVVLPTLGLVAVLVLAARPIAAALATLGTDLVRGERAFIGWMAPRGIVAAATASTFASTLVAKGIGGASKILPATFLAIVATVTLYGMTAAPVARRLGVTPLAVTRPLLVGGDAWVVDLGRALQAAGLPVLMWAPREEHRERIREAGLELAPGELLAAATGRGAELEGITAVLLLTTEDDFNALASTILQGNVDGPVYRLAPAERSVGVVAPYIGGEILFADGLTGAAILQRHGRGAVVSASPVDAGLPAGHDLLVVVSAGGRMQPVTAHQAPAARPGDTAVLLGPVPAPATASPAG